MIHLTQSTPIMIAVKPVDFRQQIDGLAALCRRQFNANPQDGSLYVFTNRARTMIRILHYERNGYWLATKRLSQGKFSDWPLKGEPLSSQAAAYLMKIIRATSCE